MIHINIISCGYKTACYTEKGDCNVTSIHPKSALKKVRLPTFKLMYRRIIHSRLSVHNLYLLRLSVDTEYRPSNKELSTVVCGHYQHLAIRDCLPPLVYAQYYIRRIEEYSTSCPEDSEVIWTAVCLN